MGCFTALYKKFLIYIVDKPKGRDYFCSRGLNLKQYYLSGESHYFYY